MQALGLAENRATVKFLAVFIENASITYVFKINQNIIVGIENF